MKRATVVIGANYGDEGKGKLVDYLASITSNTTVVRFNGGAQAGHTVEVNNKRHVFQHVGSGALAGANTYLAKHFVLNPILFWHEYPNLSKLLEAPLTIACDPRCYVTTPYDMLINQLLEDHRGANRHGSCGIGFGETIERCNYPAFRLTRTDLDNSDSIRQKITNIRDSWLPNRLQQLNIPRLAKTDPRLREDWINVYLEACRSFIKAVPSAGLEFLSNKNVIFEGAQGLLLDMTAGVFPHVTRSNTGLTNVVPIARALALELDVIYVSRTYLTRHGAGPIKNQFEADKKLEDLTNKDHPYQGSLRFGHLDPRSLQERILSDAKLGGRSVINTSIALTWLDKIKLDIPARPIPVAYKGFGPQRSQLEGV